MSRFSRFKDEFRIHRSVGWPIRFAIRNAWRRSHPDAKERYRKWIAEICGIDEASQ